MKELKALTQRMRDRGSPAQNIGEFLLKHSNSPEYLASNLKAFYEAALADFEEDARVRNMMLQVAKEQEEQRTALVAEKIEQSHEWYMVEREGPDIRFDWSPDNSFWLRATEGGWDAEGVSRASIAELLRMLGFKAGKASEGYYYWRAA